MSRFLINGYDLHSDLMALNDWERQINLILCPFVLNRFTSVAVLISTADAHRQNAAQSGPLLRLRKVKFTNLHQAGLH